MNLPGLRRLFLLGVIKFNDYWTYRKMLKKKNFRIRHTRKPFTLDRYDDDECVLMFRFKRREILKLCQSLQLPKFFVLANRNRCSGLEGLCIVLRRLSYPNRLCDLVETFNRDVGTLSRLFNCALRFLNDNWSSKLTTFESQPWITTEQLETFAQACVSAGSYYDSMVGFIDGTARRICRPKYFQKKYYSGYKKTHCLKYQSVVLPNGLIGRLDGPFNGRRHDAAVLGLSNLKDELRVLFARNNNSNFCIYGDSGYSNQKYIKTGFKNYGGLSAEQRTFNADMSALRVSVEYGFGKIVQQFAFLDFKPNQKLYLQYLKQQYLVAALLVNCQTCLRKGNQISKYFYCKPPDIDTYLQL